MNAHEQAMDLYETYRSMDWNLSPIEVKFMCHVAIDRVELTLNSLPQTIEVKLMREYWSEVRDKLRLINKNFHLN